jgi:citrate lyase subunit beta/citryl-CoA lyase
MELERQLGGAVLFTPGDRPERFAKAWSASGGSLILDLEDAVADDCKALARTAVRDWLDQGFTPLVRINAASTEHFAADVIALAGARIRGVLMAKTHTVADVSAIHRLWPGVALYPLIESPEGLANVHQIARGEGVAQLCLGMLDLSAACGVAYPNDTFLSYARIQLTLASAAAGLTGAIDTPHPAYRELAAVAEEARTAAALGFTGKLCIHPAQLAIVNAAFMPSREELQWAEEVVAAGRSGGVAVVRGTMVDAPVIARAHGILRMADRMKESVPVTPAGSR